MDRYVRGWAQLEIQAYSWETGLPEVGEENEIILLTRNRKFSCRIGELDPLKGSYPLVCPEGSIEVWVAAKNLEPLIETSYQDLIPRLISETPFPLLGRIEVTLGSGKLTFFRKNDVWFRQENATSLQGFAILEFLLATLGELEYTEKLSLNEKSALFFDPSEVGLIFHLYIEPEDTVPFREFKFYIRESNYLEIDSAPPLYLLRPNSLEPFFNYLLPLIYQRQG